MPLFSPTKIEIPAITSTTVSIDDIGMIDDVETVLADPNLNRKSLLICNRGEIPVFIDFHSNLSVTNYAFSLEPGMIYELPADKIYTGVVYGIAVGGNTICAVREFE